MKEKVLVACLLLLLILVPAVGGAASKSVANLAFEGLKDAYYPGQKLIIAVTVNPIVPKGTADLYVFMGSPGYKGFLYFSDNPKNPLSFKPVPVKRDIAMVRKTYKIFEMTLPALPSGLVLDLYAGLNQAGSASLDPISNVVKESIKIIGVSANAEERKQAQTLRILQDALGGKILNARISDGTLRKLDLGLAVPKSLLPAGTTSEDVVMVLLPALENLLRIKRPFRNLRLIDRIATGFDSYLFRQYYMDIPVFGSWFKILMEDTGKTLVVRGFSGRYTPDLHPKVVEPVLSEKEAMRRVMEAYKLKEMPDLQMTVPPRLWFYDPALLASECPKCPAVKHNATLAWRIVLLSPKDGGAVADVFVDAVSGEILFNQPLTDEDANMFIFTAEGNTSSTCFFWQATRREQWFEEEGECDWWAPSCGEKNYCPLEGLGCVSPDTEGYDTFDLTHDLYDFYGLFGHDSFDGDGAALHVYLDVGFSPHNASSKDCGAYAIHQFSSGMATPDILGHEFGHSFHREEADYEYSHESGAIAEHIADMFGYFFGCYEGTDCDWQHGEDGSRAIADDDPADPTDDGCGRDMADPPRCGQPDEYSEYNHMSRDHGGVHTNSGILNKAGYLLTEGDTFNDIVVTGIGREKAQWIYYHTVRNLGSNPSFHDFADEIHGTCLGIVGSHGITNNDCCQVRNAMAAVGVGTVDRDCDGTPDASDTDDDGDGVLDGVDNCPLISNPSQQDTDGDGLGDDCDPDADGDGHQNWDDNCPFRANPGQNDLDGDGHGDVCDDSDGDGVNDASDNCPNPNGSQSDRDGDGQGDACDGDIDGDGIANGPDNCIFVANVDQANSDGDSYGDACDNCPDKDNEDQDDLDRDGEGDECDSDMDGDGIDNEDDNCPEEYTYTSEIMICPPDSFCEWGCPPVAVLDVPGLILSFNPDVMRPIDPGLERPWAASRIDLCDFGPCTANVLYDRGEVLDIVLDMEMDIASGTEMNQAIQLFVAVLDEAGRTVARDAVWFGPQAKGGALSGFQTSAQARLTTGIMPSYNWRESAKLPAAAIQAEAGAQKADPALPAYYLVLTPALGDETNRKILAKTPVKITPKITVGEQK